MKVIATTSQSLLLVDCLTGWAHVIHRGAGLYYGIARIPGGYAVAARRRNVSSSVPSADERGCILLLDPGFRSVQVLEAPFPLRDMHQVAWFDDRLWVTCSFDDMVATYDGVRWERWRPLGAPDAGSVDRYHFNSLMVTDAEIVVLAHNHGPSDMHFFDRRSRRLLRTLRLGEQAHNIWGEGGEYFTCSSIHGKLTAANGWERGLGGFTRGVSIAAPWRVAGISTLTERVNRDWTSGVLALCDTDWNPHHFVHLVREGMVLDVVGITAAEAEPVEASPYVRVRFPLLSHLDETTLPAFDRAPGPEMRIDAHG